MGVALSIAIPIIVVAAVIVLVGAARRRETMAAEGRLTRETRRRDRGRVDIDEASGEADAPHRPGGGAGRGAGSPQRRHRVGGGR